jgi:hypothetical protein
VSQYQITLSDDVVHGLFNEDGAMARLMEQVLDQALQCEVTEACQAKPFERTEERQLCQWPLENEHLWPRKVHTSLAIHRPSDP